MNCGFDSFEPDTLFFFGKVIHIHISLSMSGSAAGSISCMLSKKLGSGRRYIASNFTGVIL